MFLIERALQLGTLFSVEEALKIGLVDQVVPDIETGTAAAEAELKEFLQIPGTVFYDLNFHSIFSIHDSHS